METDQGGRVLLGIRDTHPLPLGVVYFSDVRSKWSFKALRDALQPSIFGFKEKNSFKAQDIVYILWDPGGGHRYKPWWEFLDQFKHKPP